MRYAVLNLPRISDTALTYGNRLIPALRHPVFGWLGLRPVLAQHTADEHDALRRWACDRARIVEIGVAEGVSALAMRQVMSETGSLYLIDPFHLSRLQTLNFTRRAAHRAVESCSRGKVVWIEEFSFNAALGWNKPIDLLLIDGDHSPRGVQQDWSDWNRFVEPGGVAIFHDARLFDGGWTSADYGPVRLIDALFRKGQASSWRIVEEVHSLVVVRRD
ncbi:MAG TPA: class I SAM-dependent methyltransferase [Candidatus Limnocylindrales bacterium]|nr:class I SAM-dependent methyltransferase [Candidatus Limnocylindrales bacterium]